MVVKIGFYLVGLLAAYCAALACLILPPGPPLPEAVLLGVKCAAIGGVGGCFYCLRAIYLNVSVRKQWGSEWLAWYLLRPLVSAISGGVSCLFMQAGLLVLESGTKPEASQIGFYTIAFIAGLNVDRFVHKVEEIAEAVWGIKKSGAGAGSSTEETSN